MLTTVLTAAETAIVWAVSLGMRRLQELAQLRPMARQWHGDMSVIFGNPPGGTSTEL